MDVLTEKTQTMLVEPLDQNNYESWKIRMKFALDARGLGAAVEAPSSDIKPDPEQDRKARGLSGMHVRDHLLSIVEENKTAYEVWTALEKFFKANTQSRKLQLRKEMLALKMQPNESVTLYVVGRAKALYTDMKAVGLDIKEPDMIYAVLAGVSKKFDVYVAIIINTSKEEDLKFSTVQSKLRNAEIELEESDKKPAGLAMYAGRNKPRFSGNKGATGSKTVSTSSSDNKCYHCGEPGHHKKECEKWLKKQLEYVQRKQSGENKCLFCGFMGHTEDVCRKKKRSQSFADPFALFAM
jgi:hypothetical protein